MSSSWRYWWLQDVRQAILCFGTPLALLPFSLFLRGRPHAEALLIGMACLFAVSLMHYADTLRTCLLLTMDCVACYGFSSRIIGGNFWSAAACAAFLAVTCFLSGTRRQRIEYEQQRNTQETQRSMLLSQLNMRLVAARSMAEIQALLMRNIFENFGSSSIVYSVTSEGLERVTATPPGLYIYQKELKTVETAALQGKVSGVGTSFCVHSVLRCYPIRFSGKVSFVFAVLLGANHQDQAQLAFLDGLVQRGSFAMERQRLIDVQQEIITAKQVEAARASFLSSISHDFRTPLTTILGACAALRLSPSLSDSSIRLIEDIREESEWLRQMVENMLSVTRMSAATPQLNLNEEAVEEIVGESAYKCTTRFPELDLHVQVPEEVLFVRLDATLITQVILNLVENAFKYGGPPYRVELSVSAEGGYAVFSVRDHGAGIPPDKMADLFTKKTPRTGDSRHGLGIGLSICRIIVQAHSGEIWVKSCPDGGADFRFSLPMEVENND